MSLCGAKRLPAWFELRSKHLPSAAITAKTEIQKKKNKQKQQVYVLPIQRGDDLRSPTGYRWLRLNLKLKLKLKLKQADPD